MNKRALVVGIDDYPGAPLKGCIHDATRVASLLEINGDGSLNFDVSLLTSDTHNLTTEHLSDAVERLFSGQAETALLYFAGHGVLDETWSSGYICSMDGQRRTPGMSLADIMNLANSASPRIRSSVIILDACQSGSFGEFPANRDVSLIGDGVTILTACHREQQAVEGAEHGLFTEFLLDGLNGGSADIVGRITPASLYSHIDQTLGMWEQRPIYKANVQSFVTLREVSPKVSRETLRRLPLYFSSPAALFTLDPTYEADRSNASDALAAIPPDPDHVRIFKELQACNRHGLVVPVDCEHMYYAAMESKACRLTALGAHYRKLAEMKRI